MPLSHASTRQALPESSPPIFGGTEPAGAGQAQESFDSLVIGPYGRIHVIGTTTAADLQLMNPLGPRPPVIIPRDAGNPPRIAMLARFAPSGKLAMTSYLGGWSDWDQDAELRSAVALDSLGDLIALVQSTAP